MPIYEYYCEVCDRQIEVEQKINDPAPECDHRDWENERVYTTTAPTLMKRQISLSSFSLKGQGWAKDKYGK